MLPPLPPAEWPAYMRDDPGVRRNEEAAVRALEDFHDRSVNLGYFQSHPYDQMHLGEDMKLDALAHANTYMKLVFGGKPAPQDNIDLAYNHALRQMAESKVDAGSLLEDMDPRRFVPAGTCDKDSILRTFEEQRRFYKGAIDTDTERALKSRPTHNLVATTTYGRKLTESGASARYNHVRGQNDLLNRPSNADFFPTENLSSKTFAPDGAGGDVPLNYQNEFGEDARAVPVTDERRVDAPDPASEWAAADLGPYAGNEVGRYEYALEADPGFIGLFQQFKQRQ